MKKVLLVWIVVLFLTVLTACGTSTEKDKSTGENNQIKPTITSETVNSEPEADQLKTINAAGIAEKARYTFLMKQNEKSYNLYIYSDDEKESMTKDDWACANKGDHIFTGDYFIAAVEKGAENASVLSIGKHTFQVPNDGVDVIDGDPSLLVVSHCEASDMYSGGLFAVDKLGKPYQLRDLNGYKLVMNVSPSRIKSIGKNKYQTAVFNKEGNMLWAFENWELYPQYASLVNTQTNIMGDPTKLDVTKWAEDPDYIVK